MLYFFLLVVCRYFASSFCNTHDMFLFLPFASRTAFLQSSQSAISVDSNIMHSSLSICLSLLRIFKILSIRPMSVSVSFSSCNPSIPSLKRLLFSVSVWTMQITSIFCLVFVCYCTACLFYRVPHTARQLSWYVPGYAGFLCYKAAVFFFFGDKRNIS